MELTYTLADLRRIVWESYGGLCPYCSAQMTEKNISLDHSEPVSRGGSWCDANLIVCCRRCNEAKGKMTDYEYRRLLEMIAYFPEEVETDIIARLRAGNRRFFRKK